MPLVPAVMFKCKGVWMSMCMDKSQLCQWLIFVLTAYIFGYVLEQAAIPAALLLGPMVCAIVMGVCGATIRVPKICFRYGQGLVGLLIANTITLQVLTQVLTQWELMLCTTLVTLLLSVVVGILTVRFGRLPGTTAAWGTSPGGAAAMVAMAEDYGADTRVVATMQYIRVICVILMAALVSHLLSGKAFVLNNNLISPSSFWSQAISINMLLTITVLVIGVWLGRFVPAGSLLVPLILGVVLHLCGLVQLVLPHEFIVVAYGLLGGYIGLRFNREALRYVMYAMPVMISASMFLIILCGLSALGVSYWTGEDYLSAYLATSPGGLDSLSIIALDVHANVGLVVAMQSLRLFTVVLVGPLLAKFIARFAISS